MRALLAIRLPHRLDGEIWNNYNTRDFFAQLGYKPYDIPTLHKSMYQKYEKMRDRLLQDSSNNSTNFLYKSFLKLLQFIHNDALTEEEFKEFYEELREETLIIRKQVEKLISDYLHGEIPKQNDDKAKNSKEDLSEIQQNNNEAKNFEEDLSEKIKQAIIQIKKDYRISANLLQELYDETNFIKQEYYFLSELEARIALVENKLEKAKTIDLPQNKLKSLRKLSNLYDEVLSCAFALKAKLIFRRMPIDTDIQRDRKFLSQRSVIFASDLGCSGTTFVVVKHTDNSIKIRFLNSKIEELQQGVNDFIHKLDDYYKIAWFYNVFYWLFGLFYKIGKLGDSKQLGTLGKVSSLIIFAVYGCVLYYFGEDITICSIYINILLIPYAILSIIFIFSDSQKNFIIQNDFLKIRRNFIEKVETEGSIKVYEHGVEEATIVGEIVKNRMKYTTQYAKKEFFISMFFIFVLVAVNIDNPFFGDLSMKNGVIVGSILTILTQLVSIVHIYFSVVPKIKWTISYPKS